MQAFVVADVHGFYDEMIEALSKVGYDKENPNHCFVSLGDLMDRGPKPKECLEFVNSLPAKNKILIRGNHEDLIVQAIRRKYFGLHDVHNKTMQTAFDLTDTSTDDYKSGIVDDGDILRKLENYEPLNTYLDSCMDYFENNNVIFVHGWIPCFERSDGGFIFDEDWRNDNWDGARWICGFDAWHSGVVVPDKTIWCGHWHTSYAHYKYHKEGVEWYEGGEPAIFTPFEDVGIIGMDGCTAYSGIVNCKKIGKFKR